MVGNDNIGEESSCISYSIKPYMFDGEIFDF